MRFNTREFLLRTATAIAVTCAAALILLPAVASSAPVATPPLASGNPALGFSHPAISSLLVR